MVSFRVSPLDELVALGSENPITRAPSRLAAVSKLSRVRVEGSKNRVGILFKLFRHFEHIENFLPRMLRYGY